MNLDQQLRAALSREAEMQNAPAPDVDKLISGGKVRQRRRRMARFAQVGIAAAVAVLVAGGVYGVMRVNSGTTNQSGPTNTPATTHATTSANVPPYPTHGSAILPGRYRMYVGANDATGVPISADLTFSSADWQNSNFPVLNDAGKYGAVAAYQPLALGAGTGCLNDRVNDNLDNSPLALAHQFEHLPQSTVLQSPTSVQKFGQDAVHLRLRIVPNCSNIYRVAMTLRGGHGVSYGPGAPVVIDFWVMNVNGVRVVVDAWHQEGASSQMLDQINRTVDSITFATGQ
jgi:hypothetical protein